MEKMPRAELCRVLCGVDSKTCSAYHTQGGQPTHQQPEEVEEGMKVNVIGDEQDNTVPKETIALGREMRGSSLGLEWPLALGGVFWPAPLIPSPQIPGGSQTTPH